MNKKYCKFCGELIDVDCIICPKCGKQIENLKSNDSKIIIPNPIPNKNIKNKWAAFFLCLFLGFLGAHKFYERKILLGIVYILTLGFFGIGILIDLISILFKPNPYTV